MTDVLQDDDLEPIYCLACGSCGDPGCCGPEGNGFKAVCFQAPNCLYPQGEA